MNTANILERQSLSVGFYATFQTAGDIGTLCRSDSYSTWFKFPDGSIICFDTLSDGSNEITTCDC